MKTKQTNGLHKAELNDDELHLLVHYYNDAIGELKEADSPLLNIVRDKLVSRREELESMFDGRHWNRGKGRKPKAAPDVGPALPMGKNNLILTDPPKVVPA